MKVLGYYVHKDDKELNSYTVMVIIDDNLRNGKLTCFCPQEGHSECDRGYLKECIKITKDQYKESSRLFYTPEDYLM